MVIFRLSFSIFDHNREKTCDVFFIDEYSEYIKDMDRVLNALNSLNLLKVYSYSADELTVYVNIPPLSSLIHECCLLITSYLV